MLACCLLAQPRSVPKQVRLMPMMLAPAQAVKTAAADVRAGFGCLPQPKRAKTTLADAYDARLRRRKAQPASGNGVRESLSQMQLHLLLTGMLILSPRSSVNCMGMTGTSCKRETDPEKAAIMRPRIIVHLDSHPFARSELRGSQETDRALRALEDHALVHGRSGGRWCRCWRGRWGRC